MASMCLFLKVLLASSSAGMIDVDNIEAAYEYVHASVFV